MAKRKVKELTGAAALKAACDQAPADLDARLIYADALDDDGRAHEAALQRRLVWLAREVRQALFSRPVGGWVVSVQEWPVNVRISYVQRVDGHNFNRTVYAWVRKKDGAVFRGSWQRPDVRGGQRFLIHDDDDAVRRHVQPYGLAYRKDLKGDSP